MSGVDPVAAGGFASAAPHYARARPAYARGAIGLLRDTIGAGAVLDVGAGTGILSGQLTRAGRSVTAVEPLAPMLEQLRRSLPAVACIRGTAEALPVMGGSFEAVTVAQAFHWMDAPIALAEFARVLRPGGMLALIWNVRDETVAWVAELTDLMELRSGGRPYSGPPEKGWAKVVAEAGGFEPEGEARFPNPVACSPALLEQRVRSTSFVAAMEPGAREALVEEVGRLLSRTPALADRQSFEYPHTTRLHMWTRVDG